MLVSKDDCLLLVVDLQDKLLSKVETKFNLLKNTEILIKTFKTLRSSHSCDRAISKRSWKFALNSTE